ncbi:MAG: transcription-repair coupling factor, partial [Deltaproteobacteria bacterium]|nr:transcription-repair coupling factor [Deltaproteobacteria bacterium]
MQSICKRLLDGRKQVDICGLHGGSAALFAARLQGELGRSLCCIVPTDELLDPLAQDIGLFTEVPVVLYPAFEIAPYTQLAPDPATVATRLSTLYFLQESTEPCIVLTSAEAILRRIMPRQVLADHCELVMAGEETDRDGLIAALAASGYQLCDLVQQPGDMAVRGGIIDLFAPSFQPDIQGPLRLDFFGDTVESIRTFDPLSQRSLAEFDEAVLLPASDILFPLPAVNGSWQQRISNTATKLGVSGEGRGQVLEQLDRQFRFPGIEFLLPLLYQDPAPQTLFDYLPQATPCLLHDPVAIQGKVELVWDRIRANYQEAAADRVALAPDSLFLEQAELDTRLRQALRVGLCTLPDPDAVQSPIMLQVGDHSLLRQEIDLERKKRGLLAPLADRLINWQQAGDTTILACSSSRQAVHFEEMLAGYQVQTARATVPLDLSPRSGELFLLEHP